MTEAQILLPEHVERLAGIEANRSDAIVPSVLQFQAVQASLVTESRSDDPYSGDEVEVILWDEKDIRPLVSSSASNEHAIDYVLMAAMFAVITFLWMQ